MRSVTQHITEERQDPEFNEAWERLDLLERLAQLLSRKDLERLGR